jgi:hypothetical protein
MKTAVIYERTFSSRLARPYERCTLQLNIAEASIRGNKAVTTATIPLGGAVDSQIPHNRHPEPRVGKGLTPERVSGNGGDTYPNPMGMVISKEVNLT